MIEKIPVAYDDEPSVIGGVELPPELLTTPDDDEPAPDDDLGRLAYWLMKFHPPAVPPQFQVADLFTMDDDAKRELIKEIQQKLGIKPFKTNVL